MADLAEASKGRLIAIDGKTLRHRYDKADERAAIHMVSAWCETNRLVLGQLATEEKSNEITAIPRLLKMLDLRGAVVTIDAIGCQKVIAKQIVEQGGDYILQVKRTQLSPQRARRAGRQGHTGVRPRPLGRREQAPLVARCGVPRGRCPEPHP